MPKASVSLRIDSEILYWLKFRADAENRTLSNMITTILSTEMSKYQAANEYEQAVDMLNYCERYEPTFNSEDGSL